MACLEHWGIFVSMPLQIRIETLCNSPNIEIILNEMASGVRTMNPSLRDRLVKRAGN